MTVFDLQITFDDYGDIIFIPIKTLIKVVNQGYNRMQICISCKEATNYPSRATCCIIQSL